MAEFRLSIPSLPDPVNDTYNLPAFFDPIQSLEVIVYKISNQGIDDPVTLSVGGALLFNTGSDTELAYITNIFDGYSTKIIINQEDILGSFIVQISAVSHHTIYVEGRRSVFSCPKTLNLIGEADTENTIGFEIKNLDTNNNHTINIHNDFTGSSSVGVYHSSIRATQESPNNSIIINANTIYNMRFIVKNANVQNTIIKITIINAVMPGDIFDIICHLDIIDSLKLYGDSMVRRLFAEEVLSSTVRVGGARIIFDEAAQKLRFMINDKEQSTLSTSSAFVPDIIEHDSQNPKSRVKITPAGEVQMTSISPSGVETTVLELDLTGRLRIQSGIAFVPSILNKDTSKDFVLNINIDDPLSPALELRNGNDVKLRLDA